MILHTFKKALYITVDLTFEFLAIYIHMYMYINGFKYIIWCMDKMS